MHTLTRRAFLHFTATSGVVTWLAGCVPIQPPTPVVQPAAEAVVARLPVQEVNLLHADTVSKVEKMIQYTMKSATVPGMAVCVVKDGEVVYAKGFGVSDIDSEEPITLQSIFQVMDLTHTFTALSALQLVERGKLDLDAPIVEYLPYFQLADERYTQITMRHLLSETAGLPLTQPGSPELDWKDKTPQTDDESLERYVRSLSDVQLESEPGEQSLFCNMAYDIAGDVIAKASGEVYEDYMEQNVLVPLGMTGSTFYPERVDASLRVTPHVAERMGDAMVSELATWSRERAPSVGLFTNLDDLTRWTLMHLNRGELDGVRIVQETTFDQLWQPVLALNWDSDYQEVALAWFLGVRQQRPIRHYMGRDAGFHGSVYLAPEEQIGVVALGNQYTNDFQTSSYANALTSTVLDIVAQG